MYAFISPFSKESTITLITGVITSLGGSFRGKVGVWRAKGFVSLSPARVRFDFQQAEAGLVVHAKFQIHSMTSRRFWRTFVEQLVATYPTVDFGINDKTPYQLAAVVDVVDASVPVVHTRTKGALAGAILGYWAFGPLGAFVGSEALSQRETTIRIDGHGRIRAKVLWNDGLMQELVLYPKQPLYRQVVKMYGGNEECNY